MSRTLFEAQRCALFSADHLSIAAQRLRFWLYFMSPNWDWPGLTVAHFTPERTGPSCWLGRSQSVCWPPPSQDGEGHFSSSSSPWVVGLSAYLHLSTGAGFSLHPSPSSFLWDYLTYSARLLLQLLNKTRLLFVHTSRGKTLLLDPAWLCGFGLS